MEVYFSRHARRRARLYKLDLVIIADALKSADSDSLVQKDDGQHQMLIRDYSGKKEEVALKVIFAIEHERITVITVYPLRKRLK